jgi:hypothetical protein
MGVVASVSSTLSFGLVSGEYSAVNYRLFMKLSVILGGHIGMVFGWLIPCLFVGTVALSMAELTSSMPCDIIFLLHTSSYLTSDLRTSAGLYYFAAKLAPPGYGPLASWITGTSPLLSYVTLELIASPAKAGQTSQARSPSYAQ